jgi:aerobic-type carbon monoxide dehydrogenase small subunit (CoxS/CutS family)
LVPVTPLLYVLRNALDIKGPRFGCGLGQCGACTGWIKGEAVPSCVRPVASAQGVEITTLEGLADGGRLHPVQQAWIEEQVPQCGYCQNGMMIKATELLNKVKRPTEDQIKSHMNTHLCRCGTYPRITKAIKRAASTMAKGA